MATRTTCRTPPTRAPIRTFPHPAVATVLGRRDGLLELHCSDCDNTGRDWPNEDLPCPECDGTGKVRTP